jgi:spermidine synthase
LALGSVLSLVADGLSALVSSLEYRPPIFTAGELAIGVGAFLVPRLFETGADYLLKAGESSSTGYLFGSAMFIVVAILPWCVMMGATFPLMMAFITDGDPKNRGTFSFLYLANVMGAWAGTMATASFLVESFGFRKTYMIAEFINFSIAATSFMLARIYPMRSGEQAMAEPEPLSCVPQSAKHTTSLWLNVVLFTTGFTSLAMEVVWTRAFTFALKTTIYAFAAILATYLIGTWIGSYFYKRRLIDGRIASTEVVLAVTALFSLLPAVLNDPRFDQNVGVALVGLDLVSILPFCLTLGYLTPRLIDEYSSGDPARAGRCYSVNIAGGILGPLFAAYALLPMVSTRVGLVILSIPMFLLALAATQRARWSLQYRVGAALPYAAILAIAVTLSRDYEDGAFYSGPHEIRRDHVASVVAFGEGMDKGLLVNGVAITSLTPITKIMAHLPLAMRNGAQSGLVICFGMGTTFRAMRSWGIDTTAVDLSPSVVASFGFFFPDARNITEDAKTHIIIDDGRRYLLRSDRMFDVITVDPPPPIEAAASSLLYSREFYQIAKAHLSRGGIVQQWFPGRDDKIQSAVAQTLRESFPYVAPFRSVEDWGYHFLASMSPIPEILPLDFMKRLPEPAKHDLMEWSTDITIGEMAENILSRRTDIEKLLLQETDIEVTDDRPYNEYYYLRRTGLLK